MRQTGYLIENLLNKKHYFTSTSSYDRPRWVEANQASVYETADSAERAMKKMIKYGVNSVRMVNLAEFAPPVRNRHPEDLPIGKELPPVDNAQMELPPEDGQELPPIGDDVAPEDEMVAGHQEEVCPECGHEPCTCDMGEHQPGDEIDVDSLDLPPEENEEIVNRTTAVQPGHTVSYKGQEFVVVADAGNGTVQIAQPADPKKVTNVHVNELLPVHEAVRPKRQSGHQKEVAAANKRYQEELDKQRAEYEAKHGETYHYGAAKVVKLPVKESADVADDCCTKIEVPSAAKSELTAVISKYEKEAKDYDGRDDARASFAMTVVGAASEIAELLSTGTVESVKQAQVRFSSFMSPITALFPASTIKFINSGGRKPTLKDFFNDKRAK